MDHLYRKKTYPSGAVRYQRVHQFDDGDPSNGIWLIERGGRSQRWINEKLFDIPRLKSQAALERYHSTICNALLHWVDSHRAGSVADLASKIIKDIAEEATRDEGGIHKYDF